MKDYYVVLGVPRRERPQGIRDAYRQLAKRYHPLYLLGINTRLLPPPMRPPTWLCVALVAMALFHGFFVSLSFWSVSRG